MLTVETEKIGKAVIRASRGVTMQLLRLRVRQRNKLAAMEAARSVNAVTRQLLT